MRLLSLLTAGALLTAVLLSACSDPGPVPLGGNFGTPAQQCVPGGRGKIITIGIYELHDTSSSPVTIQSVRLASPHGLVMTGAPG